MAAAASPEDMQANMQKWMAWIERLAKEGIYDSGEALEPGGSIVQNKDGLVSDGPFGEGKELVGGYFIINARDYAHANEIAKDCPIYSQGGIVEVRKVMVM